jgi:hypothetical protein
LADLCTVPAAAYNPQTAEEALQPGKSGYHVYCGPCGYRRARFQERTPDLDLTTNHLSFVYGPIGLGQVYNSPWNGYERVRLWAHLRCAGSPRQWVQYSNGRTAAECRRVTCEMLHEVSPNRRDAPKQFIMIHVPEHVYLEGGGRIPCSGKAGVEALKGRLQIRRVLESIRVRLRGSLC